MSTIGMTDQSCGWCSTQYTTIYHIGAPCPRIKEVVRKRNGMIEEVVVERHPGQIERIKF